jgi:hypothetical protein
MKDCGRRRREMDRLRLLGDYHNNLEVLRQKQGSLIVVRRPTQVAQYTDYLPCRSCLGFFVKSDLWRHCISCKFSDGTPSDCNWQKQGAMLIAPVIYTAACLGPAMVRTLSAMYRDDISTVVKNDPLILTYGELISRNKKVSQMRCVSARLRLLARLLIRLRKSCQLPDASLSDFIRADMFDNVVSAVLDESQCQSATETSAIKLSAPSIALKTGYSLRTCCDLLHNKALREYDGISQQNVEYFTRLFDSEWRYKVSSVALRTITDNQRDKPDLIPLTSDLIKLKNYLVSRVSYCIGQLKSTCSRTEYNNLIDVTLSRIILFNKRRGGEASRMLVSSYQKYTADSTSGADDIQQTLTATEQRLCARLRLVRIAGKGNSSSGSVPVLLTPDVIAGINCLLDMRETIGIRRENPYVFARFKGIGYVDGINSLRRVANDAQLQKPELIRSTKLRKYVATVSQLLDMKSTEVALLCRHLGHSVTVHDKYYKLPSDTLELAKVSKFLIAVERGDLNFLCGKNFDQLQIDDIPDVEEEVVEDDGDGDGYSQISGEPGISSNMLSSRTHADKRTASSIEVSNCSSSTDDYSIPEHNISSRKSNGNDTRDSLTANRTGGPNSKVNITRRKRISRTSDDARMHDNLFRHGKGLGNDCENRNAPATKQDAVRRKISMKNIHACADKHGLPYSISKSRISEDIGKRYSSMQSAVSRKHMLAGNVEGRQFRKKQRHLADVYEFDETDQTNSETDRQQFGSDDSASSANKVIRCTREAVVKKPWSKKEKSALFTYLDKHIKNGVIPCQQDCMTAIRQSRGVLGNRTWRQVKYAVKNVIASYKKRRLY